MRIAYMLSCIALWSGPSATLSSSEALKHIGERATVCGVVSTARFTESSKGKPTFINLDKPFPDSEFTVVIWEVDREKFGTPEKDWTKKKICVEGKIEDFKGKAEIVLHEKSQLTSV